MVRMPAELCLGQFNMHLRPLFPMFPPCMAAIARKGSVLKEPASSFTAEKPQRCEAINEDRTFAWGRQDSSSSQVSTNASAFCDLLSLGDLVHNTPSISESGSPDCSASLPAVKVAVGVKECLKGRQQRQRSESSQISASSLMSAEADATVLADLFFRDSGCRKTLQSQAPTSAAPASGGELLFAVKRMPNDWVCESHAKFVEAHPGETECPWTDIGCLQYLNDISFPYVCKLRGVFKDSSSTYVVSSLASQGDLLSWAGKLPLAPGRAREALIRPLLVQAAMALSQLHSLSIAHRDVSVENILVNQEQDGSLAVKLVDFGAASIEQFQTRRSGKKSYQSPEQHSSKVSGKAYDAYLSDAFALGVVAYVALLKEYPWQSTVSGQCKSFDYVERRGLRAFLCKKKLAGSSDRAAQALSDEALEFLEALLALDPEDRRPICDPATRSHEDDEPGQMKPSISELPWMQRDFTPKGPRAWHGLAVRG